MMARSPSLEENNVKKGPWTPEEDKKMVDFIEKNGHGSWRALPKLAGLNRCGKSCRLRWTNYLRPDIKRGKFTDEEEQIIINLHSVLGNKWSAIASNLQGRTDNEIKNYWNTHLKKKLMNMGIDPVTHRPRTDHLNLFANLPQLLVATNLSSLLVNHDAATQLAKVQLLQNLMQVINTTTSSQFPSNLDPNNYLFSPTSSHLFPDHRLFEYFRSVNNDFSHDHQIDFNGLGNGQVHFSHEQSQLFPLNNENLETFSSNLYDLDSNANHMPSLVSYSPENFTSNEVKESKITIDNEKSNHSSASTTIVETWGERAMDEETSDSYWKDIIDQATSFPWTPTL